ncbi:MAG: hypothetical protein HY832_01370 [Candidatus Aenigmarchaeota archaeon]|nr:hypothetical protein [Candidatus Aenigmarchaeota archaeon]
MDHKQKIDLVYVSNDRSIVKEVIQRQIQFFYDWCKQELEIEPPIRFAESALDEIAQYGKGNIVHAQYIAEQAVRRIPDDASFPYEITNENIQDLGIQKEEVDAWYALGRPADIRVKKRDFP